MKARLLRPRWLHVIHYHDEATGKHWLSRKGRQLWAWLAEQGDQ